MRVRPYSRGSVLIWRLLDKLRYIGYFRYCKCLFMIGQLGEGEAPMQVRRLPKVTNQRATWT